ncbi:MAG TPA: hypothetical protein VGB78_02875 [Thermoplasmata archaeon]
MSSDWIFIAFEIVLTIAVMLLASFKSKVVVVASLFICLSSGVMIWLMMDLAGDPSYDFPTAPEDWIIYLAITLTHATALGVLVYSVWMTHYRYLLLAAAMSSLSLLAPFGIVAFAVVWWDQRRAMQKRESLQMVRWENNTGRRGDGQSDSIGVSTAQSGGVLQYGPIYRAFPIAILLAWLALLLSIRIITNPPPASPDDEVYVLAVFLFFSIVLPWMIFLEAFWTRATVSLEGLEKRSVWRGIRFLRWEDVETISYTLWRRDFVVNGNGMKITLNDDLMGLPFFAEAVNLRLPPEKWVDVSSRLHLLLSKGQYD